MYLDPDFKKNLAPFDLEQMEQSPDVIYFLDNKFFLRGYNQAWIRFAEENGGHKALEEYPLGRSILDAIPKDLQHYYQASYGQALKKNIRFDHDFLCSSDTKVRKFRQNVYPLKEQIGLCISNHLMLEENQIADPVAFSRRHLTPQGFIIQCSHCRNVQNQARKGSWEWVPDLVANPKPNVSHGICPRCLMFYYREEGFP